MTGGPPASFEVLLVNAHHVKNVPGRKTDVLDCQWIQQLHSYGLLRGAFRPGDTILPLRAYMRQRANLVRYAGMHIQHMQKALDQMNIQRRYEGRALCPPAGRAQERRGTLAVGTKLKEDGQTEPALLAWQKQAEEMRKQNRLERVADAFRAQAEINPEHPSAWYSLGGKRSVPCL